MFHRSKGRYNSTVLVVHAKLSINYRGHRGGWNREATEINQPERIQTILYVVRRRRSSMSRTLIAYDCATAQAVE